VKKLTSAAMIMALALLLALPAQAQDSGRTFPETGRTLKGDFLRFWDRNGGLAVFGFPLTDELPLPNKDLGRPFTVQYVERQRFELHPENQGTPYEVLLGRLGVDALEQQGRDWFSFPRADPSAPHYFAETGHAIGAQFWDYWRTHGLEFGDRSVTFRESLALFGYPISEPAVEANSSGDSVLTQWFERARFEYHPDNPNPYKVLLGRLGAETAGFHTAKPAMLKAGQGAYVAPIISVGDTLPNDYRYEGIPDGIGITPGGKGRGVVFVSHETSTVPFPAVGQPGAAADFHNAEISELEIGQASAGVLLGGLDWSTTGGYQRFCSGFLAGPQHGFAQPVYFTGEETSDVVSLPPNPAWPPTGATRQAGYVVAVASFNGQQYTIPGMGRMNHENTIIVPGGWNKIVALTDDDTFNAPAAQVYMYVAGAAQDLLDDKGQLYAFVSDDPSVNDYGDMATGTHVSGRFILVPREIALGDQTALENWSNANNAFQFIRTEDMATDKNNPRVVYIADTGEPRAVADPSTGRLARGPSSARGPYPNGRIFKMTLSAADPLRVDSFELLIDADATGYNKDGLHNPDNLDTSGNSLMIQEDPISVNNFDPGQGPAARIWRYDFQTGKLSIVAEVDQSADPQARLGSWESTGIVNAAALFGPGTWLVNIQAHSLLVQTEAATGYTRKLEGGQLLLLMAPGT
jgi:Alkaline phosphatase PhoX